MRQLCSVVLLLVTLTNGMYALIESSHTVIDCRVVSCQLVFTSSSE